MINFTAKELLLSTKDKLRELENKLKLLSDMTCIEHDKNIESVRYVLQPGNNHSSNKPELCLVVKWSDNSLKGMINNILVRMNLYRWGGESGLVLRNNNGESFIKNDEYSIFIPKEKQQEFGFVAEDLLKDQCVPILLDHGTFYSLETGSQTKVEIFPSPVSITKKNSELENMISFLYYPEDQKACFITQEGSELTDESLQELLNAKLDPSYYSDYIRSMIEQSDQTSKGIIIPHFSDITGKLEFDIEENHESLHLIKK